MRGAPWLGHLYFDTVPDYLQVQKQGFTDWYTQEQMNKMLTKAFEERSSKFWILSSLMLVSFLGLVDYATGNEFSFSLFYLIPIASTTWHVKFKTGLFIAALSAITWAVADFFCRHGLSAAHHLFLEHTDSTRFLCHCHLPDRRTAQITKDHRSPCGYGLRHRRNECPPLQQAFGP